MACKVQYRACIPTCNMAESIFGNSPKSDNGRVEPTTSELGSFHGFLTNRRACLLHTVLPAFVSVEYGCVS